MVINAGKTWEGQLGIEVDGTLYTFQYTAEKGFHKFVTKDGKCFARTSKAFKNKMGAKPGSGLACLLHQKMKEALL